MALASDAPDLLDARRTVREHETIPEERAGDNPLGRYTVTPDRIRFLKADEVERREREAKGERAAKYRRMYEELRLRVEAHKDETLEAAWRFDGRVLRLESDTSPNRHATKHFHATAHPLVQSFEPGEDWIWCYVDEVVVKPRR